MVHCVTLLLCLNITICGVKAAKHINKLLFFFLQYLMWPENAQKAFSGRPSKNNKRLHSKNWAEQNMKKDMSQFQWKGEII